jgi:hypothetical protein
MKIVNFLRTRAEKEKNLRDFTLFEDFITISFIEKYSALIFISTVNSDVLSATLIIGILQSLSHSFGHSSCAQYLLSLSL